MNMYSIIDLLVVAAGIYLIYIAVQMKRTGEVRQNGLISKGIDLKKAPDSAGYVRVMAPWNFALGIGVVLCGAASMYAERTGGGGILTLAASGAALVLIIVFGVVSMRAQKKYLE